MKFLMSLFQGLVNPSTLKHWIRQIAVIVGISTITYTGFSIGISGLLDHLKTNYNGLPADAIQVLALAKVPQALSVILTAFTTRLGMMGLNAAGGLTRFKFKRNEHLGPLGN